jgi:hypothetical protein
LVKAGELLYLIWAGLKTGPSFRIHNFLFPNLNCQILAFHRL